MMAFRKHLFLEIGDIVDACHGHNREFAEMTVDYDGLCVSVGNYSYS